MNIKKLAKLGLLLIAYTILSQTLLAGIRILDIKLFFMSYLFNFVIVWEVFIKPTFKEIIRVFKK